MAAAKQRYAFAAAIMLLGAATGIAIYRAQTVSPVSPKQLGEPDAIPRSSASPSQTETESLPRTPVLAQQEAVVPAGETVSLLPHVDLQEDVVTGQWESLNPVSGTLMSGLNAYARIELPFQPSEEYDLSVTFSPVDVLGDTTVLLSKGRRQFAWHMGAASNTCGGLDLIDLRPCTDNPTTLKRLKLESGREYVCLIKVRNDGVTVLLDGVQCCRWQSDYNDMSSFRFWRTPNDGRLGLGTWCTRTTFRSVEVTNIGGAGKLLRTSIPGVLPRELPPLPEQDPWTGAKELTTKTDSSLDAVSGSWAHGQKNELLCSASDYATLALPGTLPDEYDVRYDFSRLDGSGEVVLILAQHRQMFALKLGSKSNNFVGFDHIAGIDGSNPTWKYAPSCIKNLRRNICIVQVRKGSARAFLNGHFACERSISAHDMSLNPNWRMRDEPMLGIGCHQSTAAFYSIQLREAKDIVLTPTHKKGRGDDF